MSRGRGGMIPLPMAASSACAIRDRVLNRKQGVHCLSNPDPDKVTFIKAVFDKLRVRIENLPELNASPSFRTEALMLCLVYIDGLASNYYAGGDGRNKENFCRALREFSGDATFGKLHVKMLLDPDNDKYWAAAKIAVEELSKSRPGELL